MNMDDSNSALQIIPEEENLPVPLDQIDSLIVELHLDGRSNIAIAQQLNCSPQTISNRLNKKEVKQYIESILSDDQVRLERQHHKFVDAIADGLKQSEGIGTRLKAARLFNEVTKDKKDNRTAEDIVQKLLSIQAENVQVNLNINAESPKSLEEE